MLVVVGSKAEVVLDYDPARLDAWTVDRMAQALRPGARWPSRERRTCGRRSTSPRRASDSRFWSNGIERDVAYPLDRCLHELIEAQVERAPDRIAVEAEEASLTDRDLDERANQLARFLRTLGVGPGKLAGVAMERSADMVVSLLGTLKSGAAYVPLDPTASS